MTKDLHYFDIHSHLNFSQFDDDRTEIIREMKEKGIWTITVGTGAVTSRESVDLAKEYDHLYATVGIHPTEDGEVFKKEVFDDLMHEKVVAIGECGLDYYRINEDDVETKEHQKANFRAHIEYALEADLPLMIHGRPKQGTMDAYEDILRELSEYKEHSNLRGNVHFFVGSIDIARSFLNLNFSLSFDGPVTFDASFEEVVEFVPEDMIMAETDAPFAAPVPFRGKRNSPLYVPHIVKTLATMRNEDEESFKRTLVTNALTRFAIEP